MPVMLYYKNMLKKLPFFSCVLVAIFYTSLLRAETTIAALGFDEQRWITPATAVGIKITNMPAKENIRLVFFIGKQDISMLVRSLAPGEYYYAADILPLPPGEQELLVFIVDSDNQWEELGRLSIKILSSYGLESSQVEPRLSLTEKSLIYTDTNEEGVDLDPKQSHDLSMQGGISTIH